MFCSRCGVSVPEGSAFCGSCGLPATGSNIASPPAGVGGAVVAPVGMVAADGRNYAGFWLRFVAVVIDRLILGIPLAPVTFLLIASALPDLMHMRYPMVIVSILPRIMLILFIYLMSSWLYWALLESSAWQATLGKKALGLYVTDLAGNRPTFGRASGRFFAGRGIAMIPSLGGLYYLLDCIMAGFTEKKQALHDMIASCLVMRNP
jgi:uncharacterized RDD family membrane protein YckC